MRIQGIELSQPFRFQEGVKKALERRRADVVELSQEMTESMAEIHHAIIQCMTLTLADLKRSNTSVRHLTSGLTFHRCFSARPRRPHSGECVLQVV